MKNHKDRKIRVNVGKTVNLGNYESLRLDMSYESTIPDNCHLEDEFDEVFNFIDDLLEETLLEKAKK